MDEFRKPWYARSSFSSMVVGLVSLALCARRVGWHAVPDEMILGGVGLVLNFLVYLKASPSDRTV